MLHNEKENLEMEKCMTEEELKGHSDNCFHRPFLLKKIEGIDFRVAGIEEEMEGIEQLWKDLGVASEQDTLIWRDEDKEIDILAPLWVLEVNE